MSKIFGRYLFIHFGPLIAFMQMCIPSLRDIRLKDQQRDGGGGGQYYQKPQIKMDKQINQTIRYSSYRNLTYSFLVPLRHLSIHSLIVMKPIPQTSNLKVLGFNLSFFFHLHLSFCNAPPNGI